MGAQGFTDTDFDNTDHDSRSTIYGRKGVFADLVSEKGTKSEMNRGPLPSSRKPVLLQQDSKDGKTKDELVESISLESILNPNMVSASSNQV